MSVFLTGQVNTNRGHPFPPHTTQHEAIILLPWPPSVALSCRSSGFSLFMCRHGLQLTKQYPFGTTATTHWACTGHGASLRLQHFVDQMGFDFDPLAGRRWIVAAILRHSCRDSMQAPSEPRYWKQRRPLAFAMYEMLGKDPSTKPRKMQMDVHAWNSTTWTHIWLFHRFDDDNDDGNDDNHLPCRFNLAVMIFMIMLYQSVHCLGVVRTRMMTWATRTACAQYWHLHICTVSAAMQYSLLGTTFFSIGSLIISSNIKGVMLDIIIIG
jgi:hypothetical protein